MCPCRSWADKTIDNHQICVYRETLPSLAQVDEIHLKLSAHFYCLIDFYNGNISGIMLPRTFNPDKDSCRQLWFKILENAVTSRVKACLWRGEWDWVFECVVVWSVELVDRSCWEIGKRWVCFDHAKDVTQLLGICKIDQSVSNTEFILLHWIHYLKLLLKALSISHVKHEVNFYYTIQTMKNPQH